MDVIIYTERVNRYLEKECNREFEEWKFGVSNSRREFLADLKQKFENRDDKLVKVAELKKVE